MGGGTIRNQVEESIGVLKLPRENRLESFCVELFINDNECIG